MPTPHNEAQKGEIAKVVLMPGDPNRAKWMADTFLYDVKCVNKVRGCFCFTGLTKNNKRVSIMSSGMGNASIGIYSYELFAFYDVELIIRVGTCGCYREDIDFFDILVCEDSISDSNYGSQLGRGPTYIPRASKDVVEKAKEILDLKKYPYQIGRIFASDVFYDFDKNTWKNRRDAGIMGVEMESFALYINAEYLNKKALTLLTVTDHYVKEGQLSPEQRQTGLYKMMDVAFDLAERYI